MLLLHREADFNTKLHLAWGDVATDNVQDPSMVQVHLKHSKTDQLGRGADIIIGKTGGEICPVAAVLGYIAFCGPKPGPFFLTSSAALTLDKKYLDMNFFA